LIYEFKEAWGPLCASLGVPVPEGVPVPHVDDAEDFLACIRRRSRAMTAVACTALRLVTLLLPRPGRSGDRTAGS
jgi:hypothetical protein